VLPFAPVAMRTLTVVSPVYNEERVILAFHEELKRALAGLSGWHSSVLYVVDRGSDRSLDLLRALAAADPLVSVLALSSRFGQQAALLAGLDHADADAVVMLDSDLQHPPAVIPELVARHEQGFDVVYTVRENDRSLPLVKRWSARWFYALVNAISETEIRQGAADFRLLARPVVEVFRTRIRERTLFLRGLVSWVGFRSSAVRFKPGARGGGATKYPLGRMLRFALTGVVSFSRFPLRLAGLLGLLVLAAGLVAFALALAPLAHQEPTSTTGLLLAAVAVVGGAQLVFTGVLGEYLAAVLDEVRGRPHYIVEERINLPPPARE
jgi:glycosyltransferase involved in cell wall biosynthesis